jgi:hypothetical protein
MMHEEREAGRPICFIMCCQHKPYFTLLVLSVASKISCRSHRKIQHGYGNSEFTDKAVSWARWITTSSWPSQLMKCLFL